jgi:hypothetical protein
MGARCEYAAAAGCCSAHTERGSGQDRATMSALLMAAAGSMLLARAVRDELGAWSPCGPARPSPGSRTRRRRPPAAHQAAAAVPLGPCCTPRRPDQRRRTDLRSWPELVPYTAGNPCWGNAAFLSRSTTARPLLLDNSAARRGMHRGGGCGLLGRAPRAWVVTSGTASAPIPNSTQSRDGSSVQSFHAPPASTLFCRWPAPRAPPPARPHGGFGGQTSRMRRRRRSRPRAQ